MPGCCKVQAITIWADVALWASAMGEMAVISRAIFCRLPMEKRGLSLR